MPPVERPMVNRSRTKTNTGRVAPALVLVLVLGIAAPSTASAQFPAPSATATLPDAHALAVPFAPDTDGPGDSGGFAGPLYVLTLLAAPGPAVRLREYDADLQLDITDVREFDALLVERPGSMLSASATNDGQIFFADPETEAIWTLTTGPAGTVRTFMTETSSGLDLQYPVATATCCEAGLAQPPIVYVAEGQLPWYLGADGPGEENPIHGGIDQRRAGDGQDSEPFANTGVESWEVPSEGTKALCFAQDGDAATLIAVVGGAEARVIEWPATPSDGATPGAGSREYRIAPALLGASGGISAQGGEPRGSAGIGEPTAVAALAGGRLAIGGELGLIVVTRTGNILGKLWGAFDERNPSALGDVTDLIGLASSPDGEQLFGLFREGFGEGAVVVRWDAKAMPAPREHRLCLQVGAPPGCGVGEDECQWHCPTLQDAIDAAISGDTILMPEGRWEGGAINAEALTIVGDPEAAGPVELVPPADTSVLEVRNAGHPGVQLRNVVVREGFGYWHLPSDTFIGGGALVWESAFSATQVLFTGNEADVGGGIAVINPRAAVLEQVGIVWNNATTSAGGAYFDALTAIEPGVADALTESPAPFVYLNQLTVHGNDAPDGPAAAGREVNVALFNSLITGSTSPLIGGGGSGTVFGARNGFWSEDGLATAVGEGALLADPLYLAPSAQCLDFHLWEGSPAIGYGVEGPTQPASDPTDLGMYGGAAGPWGPGNGWPEEDADCDERQGDDDSIGDDDSAEDDIDPQGSTPALLPSGIRCDANDASAPGAAVLVLLTPALRRRRAIAGKVQAAGGKSG